MTYSVQCPACDEEFDIEAEPAELADEGGCFADCPECKETEIEFNYLPDEDALIATPDQYESDEDDEFGAAPADDEEEDDDDE